MEGETLLSSELQGKIIVLLGYAAMSHLADQWLGIMFLPAVYDRIVEIVAKIESNDSQIDDSKQYLMTKSTHHTEVDYSRLISYLTSQNKKLVEELASITGLTVIRNRYANTQTPSYW